RHLADQVVAVALEERVFLHVNANDQVAARGAGLSGFAFAAEGELQAAESTGGNVDLECPPHGDVAFAAALAARIGDDLTASAAAAARLLHAEEALAHDHDAVAVAMPAERGLAAFLGARAAALRARLFARDVDALLHALVDFAQLDLEVVDEIVAGLRSAAAAAAE